MALPGFIQGIEAAAAAAIRAPVVKAAKAPPEPRGRGLRVVMQRLSITAPGLLERPFLFQVPPINQFAPQYGWDFQDVDTIGDGYRTRPGSKQLATISFDSLFVEDTEYNFVVNKAPANPIALIDELKAIGDARTPFQLLVGQPDLWGVYYDVNMAATMRSLAPSEQPGEIDARYFTVSFTEFQGLSQEQLQAGLIGDLNRSGNQTIASLSISDLTPSLSTLRDLSRKYYGTTTLWTVIAKASGLSAPGSVDLRSYYATMSPKPKIVVPSVAIAKAAGK